MKIPADKAGIFFEEITSLRDNFTGGTCRNGYLTYLNCQIVKIYQPIIK